MKHRLIAPLTRNTISLVGVILTALCAVLILLLSGLSAVGVQGGSFLGIVNYLLLPAAFVLGLVLIPVGLWLRRYRERRAAARAEAAPSPLPVIDLNSAGTRAAVVTAILLIGAVVVLLAGVSYKGVEILESTEFCGRTCHFIMQPEAVAHERSAHANVGCVQCHVGPGASWFVKSKINGLIEIVEMTLNTYPRPIPTPIHNLRPARDVCEQCHWPTKFVGDRLVIHTHYADDEKNSQTKTVLLMHVGGQAGSSSAGIHWHVGRGVRVRYLADASREKIYNVELQDPDGAHKTFKSNAVPPVDAQWRTMDCVDCHNRPAHSFHQPQEEIDAALKEGRIDTSLPFVKREGLRILQTDYPSQEQARAGITREIEKFYREQYPAVVSQRASAVAQAGRALGDIWSWNVIPEMKVTWDTYPIHLGHQQSPGCMRCHDNKHVAESGEKIGKQCDLCHNVLAEDQEAPEALKALE